MERLIVIMLLFFNAIIVPCSLYSQVNFFPPGVEWYYGFNVPGLIQGRGFTHYTITGEAVIDGRNAKIINGIQYFFDYDNPTVPIATHNTNTIYLAQNEDSIFILSNGVFKLQWHTNVQVGDSFDVENWDPYVMHILNVETDTFGTLPFQKILVEGISFYGLGGKGIIYDQFGPKNGFHYYTCWGLYDCYSPTLCRYKSDEMGQIDFSGSACDILITAVDNITAPEFAVYPNPFDEVFNLKLPSGIIGDINIEVYNIMGQLVHSKTSRNGYVFSVQIEGESDGIYFCKIEFEGKIEMIKVIGI